MASVVTRNKEGKGPTEFIWDLYANLLVEIWEMASALIGETVLALLFRSAIQKIGEKHPFLVSLIVSEEGIAFNETREKGKSLSSLEIHRGFQSLINHLFQLFSTLAEGVINKELFPKVIPKVKEAERMISLS
ncbi:MAG: hypothetical protein ACE144_18380 [Thermodesulfobacteriota bacterium]